MIRYKAERTKKLQIVPTEKPVVSKILYRYTSDDKIQIISSGLKVQRAMRLRAASTRTQTANSLFTSQSFIKRSATGMSAVRNIIRNTWWAAIKAGLASIIMPIAAIVSKPPGANAISKCADGTSINIPTVLSEEL